MRRTKGSDYFRIRIMRWARATAQFRDAAPPENCTRVRRKLPRRYDEDDNAIELVYYGSDNEPHFYLWRADMTPIEFGQLDAVTS